MKTQSRKAGSLSGREIKCSRHTPVLPLAKEGSIYSQPLRVPSASWLRHTEYAYYFPLSAEPEAVAM